jgi:hypothetical protein
MMAKQTGSGSWWRQPVNPPALGQFERRRTLRESERAPHRRLKWPVKAARLATLALGKSVQCLG